MKIQYQEQLDQINQRIHIVIEKKDAKIEKQQQQLQTMKEKLKSMQRAHDELINL